MGGCVSKEEAAANNKNLTSKLSAGNRPPAATPAPEPEPEEPAPPAPVSAAKTDPVTTPATDSKMPVVYVIYYSTYGHIKTMADCVVAGLKESGVDAKLFRVEETLSEEVLGKMHAAPKADDPIANAAELPNADGFIFGFPTRFGAMPAQMKAFFDQTGGHWMKGALVGKPASFFFSTATMGGGQETTAMLSISNLAHHGMIYVPIGYSNPKLMDMTEMHGGSAWGAGCLAGPDGSRQPSELERDVATHQGKYFGGVVSALVKGRQ